MSYGRMVKAEPALAAEVDRWLKEAAQADQIEDRAHGAERRGDETPERVAAKQRRLEVIRAAEAALEAEARAAAAAKVQDKGEPKGSRAARLPGERGPTRR